MDIQDLINKWDLLSEEITGKFNILRIDSRCVPDLFIGKSNEGRRCLILKLPSDFLPDFKSSVRQNLSLEIYKESKWIVLSLLDEQYHDLFNDLVFSIYNKIEEILDPASYVSELVKTYYKWSEFFLENSGDGLSDNQIKGLFGELVVLNELLKGSTSATLNDILDSWKGPYDTGHDFIGENINIEVKTKNLSAANVKISSEYQLLAEIGKELELTVVNVIPEPIDGYSLRDMVLLVKEFVSEKLGDYTIILKALSQKGLTLKTLLEYDHLRFNTVSVVTYDCNAEDFPKITRSSLPDTISSVSYNLNINQLQTFIKQQITFDGDTRIP